MRLGGVGDGQGSNVRAVLGEDLCLVVDGVLVFFLVRDPVFVLELDFFAILVSVAVAVVVVVVAALVRLAE